jgi:hypothetical protein
MTVGMRTRGGGSGVRRTRDRLRIRFTRVLPFSSVNAHGRLRRELCSWIKYSRLYRSLYLFLNGVERRGMFWQCTCSFTWCYYIFSFPCDASLCHLLFL